MNSRAVKPSSNVFRRYEVKEKQINGESKKNKWKVLHESSVAKRNCKDPVAWSLRPDLIDSYSKSVDCRAPRTPGVRIQALNVHGVVSDRRTAVLCAATRWRIGQGRMEERPV